jgi:hypothetical protein
MVMAGLGQMTDLNMRAVSHLKWQKHLAKASLIERPR